MATPASAEATAAAKTSIKELEQQAQERISAVKSLGTSTKPILRLYKSLRDISAQAEMFGCEGDLRSSYLMHTLLCGFFLKLVATHPAYRGAEVASERTRATKMVSEAMDTLEKLKPMLQERLEHEYDAEVLRAAQAAEEARRQEKERKEREEAEALAAQLRNLSPPAAAVAVPVEPVGDAGAISSPASAPPAIDTTPMPVGAAAQSLSQPSVNPSAAPSHTGPSAFLKSFPPASAAGSVGPAPAAAASAPPAPPARAESAPIPQVSHQPSLRRIYLPNNILPEFYDVAASNTLANIETCGILCGRFVEPPQGAGDATGDAKDKQLRVTHVIIPRQTATADTCVTSDEEQLIDVQMGLDLLTLGWIHTHPSQSCFLSSVDLHTHYSYQLMLSDAVAIVLSPKHQPNSGVFHCTPEGMKALTGCKRMGFHKHEEPFPLFVPATHHAWDADPAHNAQFIDLRIQPTVAGMPHAVAQLQANAAAGAANGSATNPHAHAHGPGPHGHVH